ncbi:MAG: hypothetical protein K2K56_08760 [Lachnospiraceae bacterium]|nr:hypothetical protein [Lachnospiraceae bacterium]
MKGFKRKLAFLLAFVMIFSLQATPVFAATDTKTANTKASIYLTPGTSGTTNTVSFNFTSLSPDATVKGLKITAPLTKHQGTAAVIVNSFVVISPSGTIATIPVASGNSATTSAFNGEKAKGTWRMYINCSCPSGGLPNAYGSSTYNPTMTITS